MTSVVANPVQGSEPFPASAEVSRISYQPRDLAVYMDANGDAFVVRFEGVVGFRVLDERDLLEFWPNCSTPNGWLFCVSAGGWQALENGRNGFITPQVSDLVREYLVAGESECVSVLCDHEKPPSVERVPSNISLERTRDR